MGLTVADSYYLKAKGASEGFCTDWETVCETLNYALSYDQNHSASLCLLGKIYVEHFSRLQEAYDCFDKVIANDIQYNEVYPLYIHSLLNADEIERAEKLVDFALTIKGIDQAQILYLSSYIEDIKGNYKSCFKILKKAKIKTYNDYHFGILEDEAARIKKKQELIKPSKKKKKKGKKKKTSEN